MRLSRTGTETCAPVASFSEKSVIVKVVMYQSGPLIKLTSPRCAFCECGHRFHQRLSVAEEEAGGAFFNVFRNQ